jgi:regulator of sigma E protease
VAVFNFLPLPMLDGGHVVLVFVDKLHRLLRGRPLSAKVYAGVQIAGLVLILGLFLAITFQDVARFVFGR